MNIKKEETVVSKKIRKNDVVTKCKGPSCSKTDGLIDQDNGEAEDDTRMAIPLAKGSMLQNAPSMGDTSVSSGSAGILRQALMSFNPHSSSVNVNEHDNAVRKISLGLVHSMDDIRLSLSSSGNIHPQSEPLTTKSFPLNSLPAGTFLSSSGVPFVSIPFGPLTQAALLSNATIPLRVCAGSLPSVGEVTTSVGNAIDIPPSEVSSVKVMLPQATVVTSCPQIFPSQSAKDDSITVIYSSIPKKEPIGTQTLPLPPMSEVKSSLNNHLPQPTGKMHNEDSQVQFSSIPAAPENMTAIKLDSSSQSSSDFSHGSSIPIPTVSIPIKFHSDNSSSSDIVIPVTSDVILSKAEGQAAAPQDIGNILTIPLPPVTIDNSLSIPMPLSIASVSNSIASVQMTSNTVANLSSSVQGITNRAPTSVWPTPAVTSVRTQVTSGTRPATVTSSSPVASSQEPVCYAMQSPTEILSQLSKASAFPTMSSSQVSSVLSALGSDTHMDLESDAAHHGEIMASQVLHPEKVSTLTQTDNLERGPPDDSLMVQQVMHMLGTPHLTEQPVTTSNSSHRQTTPLAEPLGGKQGSSYPRIVTMVLNGPAVNRDSKVVGVSEVETQTKMTETKPPEALMEPPHAASSQAPGSGISVQEFLVATNHLMSSTKTDSCQEVLLGSNEGSNSSANGVTMPVTSVFIKQEVREPDVKVKKPRTRPKKTNSAITIRDITKLKTSKKLKKCEDKVMEDNDSSSSFMEQVACFKCKFCPFLSLEKSSVTAHVQQLHTPEFIELRCDRQQLKCPGCSNVFFSTDSLEVHLKQDHQVLDPRIIVDNVVKLATKLQEENERSKGQFEEVMSPSPECTDKLTCNVPEGERSKLRVKDLDAELRVQQHDMSVTDLHNSPTPEKREEVLDMDDDLLTQQKQDIGREPIKCTVVNCEEAVAMSCEVPVIPFEDSKKTVEISPVKKRGRPKGSKNKPLDEHLLKKLPGEKDNGRLPRKDYYRCNIDNCAVSMRSRDNIEYHRRCHSGTDFVCPECKYIHCHWNGMSIHLWRCHLVDMELYSCDQCDYKTNSYGKLMNLHRWIHGTERPFLCDTCGKGFKNRKQLRNHKAIHKPKQTKMGGCEVCGRTFSNKRMLRMHMDNVHNKLRPHLCNYCGYSASSVSSLKMHMRKHTGEKPFHCELCNYHTADHNSLRRHKMRHTGDKPYKCPHCTYACIQSSTYKAHLKTKHPGMDTGLMFSCTICPFRSVKEKNYIAHLAEHKPGAVVASASQKQDEIKNNATRKKKDKDQLPIINLTDPDMNIRFAYISNSQVDNLAVPSEMAVSCEFEAEEITGNIQKVEEITGDIREPHEVKFKVQKQEDP